MESPPLGGEFLLEELDWPAHTATAWNPAGRPWLTQGPPCLWPGLGRSCRRRHAGPVSLRGTGAPVKFLVGPAARRRRQLLQGQCQSLPQPRRATLTFKAPATPPPPWGPHPPIPASALEAPPLNCALGSPLVALLTSALGSPVCLRALSTWTHHTKCWERMGRAAGPWGSPRVPGLRTVSPCWGPQPRPHPGPGTQRTSKRSRRWRSAPSAWSPAGLPTAWPC